MFSCRICSSRNLSVAVDVGLQPAANLFLAKGDCGKEKKYPLRVVHCQQCQLAQLDTTIPKEEIFSSHTYLTGMTATLDQHFGKMATLIDDQFFKGKKDKAAFDIGSNDGTQLLHFQKLGYDSLGVEAAGQIAQRARDRGVPTLTAFFNESVAKELNRKFDVINAAGVFFHMEEIHSATEGIRCLLKDDGVFLVQFLYIKSIQENGAFDQIYHEHLLYYSLSTLNTLLEMHGLSLFDAWFSPIHGGSMMALASLKGKKAPTQRLKELFYQEEVSGCNELKAYKNLERRMHEMREENRHDLHERKRQGKTIYGLGAPVKGNTLLNFFGLGKEFLDCLVEKNPLRKGLYSPGQHLPILLEEEITKHPDVYYVLAWNFREEILRRHQSLIDQGVEFYFPIIPQSSCVSL